MIIHRCFKPLWITALGIFCVPSGNNSKLCVAQADISADQSNRPNIILIVSDDQGYSDMGCVGLKPIQTPNIDRLAAEGVRATSFYVTWPACTPSRGSILTGRYPQRNGLYDMVRNDMVNYGHRFTQDEYAVSPEMTMGLDPRELTLGNMLQANGYVTGVVGKWDMGQAKRYLPRQRGFDFFYGHGNNGIDYYTHERYGIPSIFQGNERTQKDRGTYITDVFGREALAFLDMHLGKKPLLLYLAFNAPHSASTLAEDNEGSKPGVQAPEAEVADYQGTIKNLRLASYYAAVTHMDKVIGDVLNRLDESRQADNSFVIFMSDNGGSGNGGNAPLRGGKSTMWEGGLRVPFIARWPTHLPKGSINHQFLTALELVPTVLAATRSKAPDHLILDGFNMLPVLRGEQIASRTEMYWQRRSDRACRIGNWKWVDAEKGKGLYDLAVDSGETNDLSNKHPDMAEELKSRFQAWQLEMDRAEPRGPFRDY